MTQQSGKETEAFQPSDSSLIFGLVVISVYMDKDGEDKLHLHLSVSDDISFSQVAMLVYGIEKVKEELLMKFDDFSSEYELRWGDFSDMG